MELLYFAWVRETIGTGAEQVPVPEGAATVADLVDRLAERSAGHAEAFADRSRLRYAIDGRFTGADAPLAGARELAIFPPVTGG
ncbi:MAG: molybdopterin converting factor subunit 1 [Sphingomonas fennica]